ncbi:MAG: alpha/beta fold hydrolase [Acidimicrobiales bacterium]|nr:alpha/beta fold hydrolase [Acidimicrobiales bacterium]
MTVVRPRRACGTGVLVLAGSSGAVDLERAELLAAHGAVALALRWFGGPGQQPGPWQVPLETFTAALDLLAPEVDRLAIVGASFGAEAALCVAATDARLDAVVAVSPSAYVWPAADETGRLRSHWTRDGSPLPFVPFDGTWAAASEPPAFRTLYERSLHTHPRHASAATIPVEDFAGRLVLIAGEDDQVWPAADWARTIATRRTQHHLPTTVITHPEAGHRVIFPGEQPARRGLNMQRGGTDTTDSQLGTKAWPHVHAALHLDDPATR